MWRCARANAHTHARARVRFLDHVTAETLTTTRARGGNDLDWSRGETRREAGVTGARTAKTARPPYWGGKKGGGGEKNPHESVPTNLGNNNNQISKNEDGEGNIGGAM